MDYPLSLPQPQTAFRNGKASVGKIFENWGGKAQRVPYRAGKRQGDLRKSHPPKRQVRKGTRWMPRHRQAMKDVATCDKPRGAGSRL